MVEITGGASSQAQNLDAAKRAQQERLEARRSEAREPKVREAEPREDTVEISDEAFSRVQAEQAAAETRAQLAREEELSLAREDRREELRDLA